RLLHLLQPCIEVVTLQNHDGASGDARVGVHGDVPVGGAYLTDSRLVIGLDEIDEIVDDLACLRLRHQHTIIPTAPDLYRLVVEDVADVSVREWMVLQIAYL